MYMCSKTLNQEDPNGTKTKALCPVVPEIQCGWAQCHGVSVSQALGFNPSNWLSDDEIPYSMTNQHFQGLQLCVPDLVW